MVNLQRGAMHVSPDRGDGVVIVDETQTLYDLDVDTFAVGVGFMTYVFDPHTYIRAIYVGGLGGCR